MSTPAPPAVPAQPTEATPSSTVNHPYICHLGITRFRGIERLDWTPDEGINLLIGGGDTGKTTILDAISLLLSNSNTTQVRAEDYFEQDVDSGFAIEATLRLPPASDVFLGMRKTAFPWGWNGTSRQLLDSAGDGGDSLEPVFVLRVSGTADFELAYEIVQPDDTTDYLPVGVRKAIGLVRLSSDDSTNRDLRLVSGSALERLVGDNTLRSRIGRILAKEDISSELGQSGKDRLAELDSTFASRALPSDLELGVIGGRIGVSSAVGLTSLVPGGTRLPLTSWGAGTRRLASLAVAALTQSGSAITVVDEVERGLEPYRQRSIIASLQEQPGQVFLTTHSSTVLSQIESGVFWHMNAVSAIGRLGPTARRQCRRDPDAFLARLPIVAEGVTEVGFVRELLDHRLGKPPLLLGVQVTDAGGNESALDLVEDLQKAGIQVAAFVDDEGKFSGRWDKAGLYSKSLIFRWAGGCLEENIIRNLSASALEDLARHEDPHRTGDRLRSLQERCGAESKDWAVLAGATDDIHDLVISAALGRVPTGTDAAVAKRFKRHEQAWFKNADGGAELYRKAVALGAADKLAGQLDPFVIAVSTAVG